MARSDRWFSSRITWTEAALTLTLAGRDLAQLRDEWGALGVVEVDEELARDAVAVGAALGLRTLDALHLASALRVDDGDLTLATWDRRLWDAAGAQGLGLVPAERP